MEKLVRLMAVNTAILSAVVLASVASQVALPECDEKCGNLIIPYPFGMMEGCYLNDNFLINCNRIHYHPPKAFLENINIEVINISIIQGGLHILQYVARDCYTQNGLHKSNYAYLNVPMFTISSTKNKFTAIGCDTYAYIYGQLEGEVYASGCMALCGNSTTRIIRDGACSGIGCCQLEIPKGLKDLKLEVFSFENHTKVMSFNPCGYAFVIEEEKFNFSSRYIRNFPLERIPLVLDWAISNKTCLTTENKTNCICGPNSRKVNFLDDGSEYRCQCLDGFEGNPYLPDQGCQDIDECEDGSHDCESKNQCVNTQGNYTCIYLKNYNGDGRRGGRGCTPNSKPFIQIIVGIGVGIIVFLICST